MKRSNIDTDENLRKSWTLFQQGKYPKAKALLLGIVQKSPDNFEALKLLGYIEGMKENYSGALKYLTLATAANPSSMEAWYYQGLALQKLGRHEKAVACFDEALRLHPGFFEALNNIGLSLNEIGRSDEALERLDKARTLNPLSWEVNYNCGLVLGKLKRYREEIESYDRALLLNPHDAGILANRGVALSELGRDEEAIEWFDKSLAINPANAEILTNRGAALDKLARYEDALDAYRRALSIAPDYPEAHWNLALSRLLLGDFENGWKEYEWRWRTRKIKPSLRTFAKPQWRGQAPLAGRKILLYSEQGLGDTLHFCRYVELIAEMGAEVILQVQPALKTLLAGLQGVSRILATDEVAPDFDFHCPLLSVPLAFGARLDTVPCRIPYLTACSDLAAKWHVRLENDGRRQIGIVWSGSTTNTNDRCRSIPPKLFSRLMDVDARFVSLQKEIAPDAAAFFDAYPEMRHFETELNDFSDTAALIQSLDLVITVDTAVAHLAGALGKPVWILLPYRPEFRWLLNRDDSPWYSTARLFRQPERGDWEGVIADVVHQLARWDHASGTMDPPE
jgi:tetratricopeptide (TPR) repeat protein